MSLADCDFSYPHLVIDKILFWIMACFGFGLDNIYIEKIGRDAIRLSKQSECYSFEGEQCTLVVLEFCNWCGVIPLQRLGKRQLFLGDDIVGCDLLDVRTSCKCHRQSKLVVEH